MDSSDDSFAWTEASSDSSIMTPVVENDDHAESSIDYEKNIQNEMFDDQPPQRETKKKKRKASQMLEVSSEDTEKSIKVELESDLEAPKRKKKRKNIEIENGLEPSQDSLLAEDYLNFRVKQEQLSFVEPEPVKKKKKKRKKEKEDELESQDSESADLSNIQNEEIDSTYEISLNNFDEPNIEIDKFEAEETVVQKKKSNKKKHSRSCASEDDLQEKSPQKLNVVAESNPKEVHPPPVTNGHIESDSDFEPKIKTKPAPQLKASKSKKKSIEDESINTSYTKIADRITFDDEESVDSEKTIANISKQLQIFLNMNTNLKPYVPDIQKENVIMDEDEVWVLRIPKEIDVKSFENINLTTDPKWKVKIKGHSYDGVIENHLSQIPLLCYNGNKCYIKNMPLMGEINLRKRIPKAHIPQESCMVNNQTNFIPLPETKCRHPLFGVDYKKAIKIPSAIAERLNGNTGNDRLDSLGAIKEKKKKQKKEKRKVEKESEPEMNTTEVQDPSPKRKRKREHSEDATKSKKSKRKKPDPDSAEAWESERAIEENLFNF